MPLHMTKSAEPTMYEPLSLNRFDHEFAARTTGEEWQRIVSLRDHPRFLDGVALHDEQIPKLFADNIVLNKAVTEFNRFQIIVFTLHLYDTADPGDPTTGLTLTRLQRLCGQYGLASAGGVAAFVGLMMLAGYLKRQPSGHDKRVVHLAPTDKFLAIVEKWNNTLLQSLDAIMPEGEFAKAHLDHPRFGWDMRRRSAEKILAGWQPLEPFPEVLHFVGRHGGWMLLLCCVAELLRQGNRSEIVPISVDLTAIGQSFGVSRTHLRRMLEEAHAKGLLAAPPRNGRYILMTPKFLAACIAAAATELSNYRLSALATKVALGLAA